MPHCYRKKGKQPCCRCSCTEIYDSLMEEEQDIKEEHPYLSQPLCYTSLTLSQIIPCHPPTFTPHEISRLLHIYPPDKTTLLTLPPHSAANKLTQIYLSSSTHQFYRPNPAIQSAGLSLLRQISETKIRPKLAEVTVNLN